MNKKNELKEQEKNEVTTIEEQQLYEDVRLILKQAKEQAYSNASAIMTHAYFRRRREEFLFK